MSFKKILLAAAIFIGCGDDSSSTSASVSDLPETISSSSQQNGNDQEQSSSSVAENKSSSSSAKIESNTEFTDPRDGQVYPIFAIKTQRWLGRNMNYAMDSSWCYNDNEKNCEQVGRAYTWESAQQACPEGWRLPTSKDWLSLIKFSSTEGNIYYGDLYDSKGFNLMRAGHYSERNDKLKWNSANESAYFWDAEEINDEYGASITFFSERNYLFLDSADNGYVLSKKSDRLSVRCIHENKGTMKDSRDGQTYKTIRLANQIWMQENLNYVADSSIEYTGRNAIENSGRLYNHSAAMNACPPGWRLPSSDEWKTLLSYRDSSKASTDRLSLKSSDGWFGVMSTYSDDDFDFTAIPAGTCRDYSLIDEGILCSDAGSHTAFWTGTVDPVKEEYECAATDWIGYGCDSKSYISIRCVKE